MKRSRVICLLIAGVAAVSAAVLPLTSRKMLSDDIFDVSAANLVTIESPTATFMVSYDPLLDGLVLESLVSSKSNRLELPTCLFYHDSLESVYGVGKDFGKEDTVVTELTVPEGIRFIGYDFFAYSALETLNLPNSLEEMDQGVCYCAGNLHTVNYNGTNLDSLSPYLFEGTPFYNDESVAAITLGNWLLRYNGDAESLNVIDLNPNIRNIGRCAFANNNTLHRVNLNGIQKIDANAFVNCGALAEAGDAYGLESIGKDAFSGTPLLMNCRADSRSSSLVLGKTLVKFSSQESVIDLGRPEFDNVTNVADGAFSSCVNAKTLILSNGISHLEDCFPHDNGKCQISEVCVSNSNARITWDTLQNYPVFSENLEVFSQTAFLDTLMEEKSEAILNQLGLTAYPLSGPQKNLSASSAYLAASRIFDYIAENYYYTSTTEGGANSFQEAFLLNPNLQCCFYASLYAYLLERAGVDAEYCISPDKTHTWNYVKIGNDWFQVDTNNAKPENKSKRFMLTDMQRFNAALYANSYDVYWDEQYPEIFDQGMQWSVSCTTLMGDLNNDHSVNILDAALLKGYLQNRSTLNVDYAYRADLNFDGIIDDADLSLLKHKCF